MVVGEVMNKCEGATFSSNLIYSIYSSFMYEIHYKVSKQRISLFYFIGRGLEILVYALVFFTIVNFIFKRQFMKKWSDLIRFKYFYKNDKNMKNLESKVGFVDL